MLLWIISILVIMIIFIIYLFMLSPGISRRESLEIYKSCYIAHRGLFNNTDIPENSMSAFKRAVEQGFAIELDVQLTRDGKAVVFHDKSLKRICGDKGILHKLSYDELQKLCLLGTQEKIPLFSEALRLISGKVPLVVEIKPEGDFLKTSEAVSKILEGYKGAYCIESFHPMVLKWFKENRPETLRGQLSTLYTKKILSKPWWIRFAMNNLMFNFITKPDFIAFDHKHRRRLSYRLCRALYKPFCIGWTLRSQRALDNSRDSFDAFIFDSFIPSRKTKEKETP